MNWARISLVALCLTLAACAIALTIETINFMREVPVMLAQESFEARELARTELAETRAQLLNKIDVITDQIALGRMDLSAKASELVILANHRSTEALGALRTATERAEATALTIGAEATHRADVALAQTKELQERFLLREPMLYSRYLALTGEAMRTMDAWRRMSEEAAYAAPAIVESSKQIAEASVKLTENMVGVTQNLTVWTKPRPWWKILLGIGVQE